MGLNVLIMVRDQITHGDFISSMLDTVSLWMAVHVDLDMLSDILYMAFLAFSGEALEHCNFMLGL